MSDMELAPWIDSTVQRHLTWCQHYPHERSDFESVTWKELGRRLGQVPDVPPKPQEPAGSSGWGISAAVAIVPAGIAGWLSLVFTGVAGYAFVAVWAIVFVIAVPVIRFTLMPAGLSKSQHAQLVQERERAQALVNERKEIVERACDEIIARVDAATRAGFEQREATRIAQAREDARRERARREAALAQERREAEERRAQAEQEKRERERQEAAAREADLKERLSFAETAPRAAEEWVLRFVQRTLGEEDAYLTQATRDGGADIVSYSAVVEVKHHAKPVGVKDVRSLFGVSRQVGQERKALFFSLGGYTPAARAFATANGVCLFGYDPVKNRVTMCNDEARSLVRDAQDGIPI